MSKKTNIEKRKFLVIADGTPESSRALRYAARRAKACDSGVVLLLVLEPGGFEHWLGVESIMKEEAREEAALVLGELAARVQSLVGINPEKHIREGSTYDALLALLEEDENIAVLVIGAAEGNNPGTLVSLLAKGSGFPISVTVVPAGSEDEGIDAIS